jgi:hypothetical protein
MFFLDEKFPNEENRARNSAHILARKPYTYTYAHRYLIFGILIWLIFRHKNPMSRTIFYIPSYANTYVQAQNVSG